MPQPDVSPPDTHIALERYRLPNGLNVILHADDALPQVVVNLWYNVGSKDESPGRSGFAHLFEHLMFMGSARVPTGGFDQLLEAQGGFNNAWTSEDATDYYEIGPSHLLETMLWLEAERMESLGRAMTQEKLDLQRDVVRNERRQSYEDQPYGGAWLAIGGALYPPDHPYHHPVIGSHEDIIAATLDDVRGFFDRWYQPDNASLVVAGDFEPTAAREAIARWFGALPAAGVTHAPPAAQPDLPQVPLVELTDSVQVAQTMLIWHSPPAFADGDAELDLLSTVLSQGRSSRLYRRLVYDEGRAMEVEASQMSQRLGSLFLITARPTEKATIEELEEAIFEELERLAERGPTADELDRARNQEELSMLRSLESLQGRALALNRYQASLGEPDGAARDLARYRGATVEGLRQAAARLTRARAAILRVRPDPNAATEAATEADASEERA